SPAGRVLISKQEQIKRIDEQLQRTQESLRRLIKSNRLNEELSLEWQKESAEASVDAQDLLISLVIDGIGAYVSEMEETDNKERAKVLDHLFGRGEENANSSIHSAYGALVNRRVELARIQEELRFASKENDLRIKIRDFSMDKGRAYTLENLYDVVTQWKKVEDLAGPYKDLSDAAYTIYRQVESWQILTTVKENGENNLRAAALLQQQIRKLVIQKQALKASSAR
ncbi:MAG TPA: hypothetical protein VFM10_02295, partial [Terriglobales bacterium]|nr:hypothetical protein [Terriglobales bacterium]